MEVIETLRIKAIEELLTKLYEKTKDTLINTDELDNVNEVHREYKVEFEKEI